MKDSFTFEKALTELEQIVSQLEEVEASLDDSLALFEKGVQLAKFLRKELDRAEKKIEILLKDKDGELKPESFSLDEENQTPSSGESEPEDKGGLPF